MTNKRKYTKLQDGLYMCRCGILWSTERKAKKCDHRNALFVNRDKNGEPYSIINLNKIDNSK